jgi:hypothetical protein
METILKKISDLLGLLIMSFGFNDAKTKYQTITITKANLTQAGRYTDAEELDTDYEYCDGIQVKELGNGGINYYSIGIEDKNNTYHSITHKDDFITSTSVDPDRRYKKIYIPVISGQKIEIKTEFESNLAAELKYQVIFRLRKNKK